MTLLRVAQLRVEFPVGRNWLGRPRSVLRAVDDVSLQVDREETLGLVGESGSGKSTLGRGILQLVPVAGGRVEFGGQEITGLSGRPLRRLRRRMHLIFQDPYSSLDPSHIVSDIVGEPLDVHEDVGRSERDERIVAALEHVGLGAHHLHRYPHEFSGGQRQRIAIARALVTRPEFIVCDEAVSALDVSTQSQIVNLLEDLQAEFGLSYLFVAHDLAVVRHISHRIAVMYLGQIVEHGPAERVYSDPAHPYTASLVSAILHPHPARQRQRERILLSGELPSPMSPPRGCRFHTRCPFAMDICREVDPLPTPVEGGGEAACHLHTEGPRLQGGSVRQLLADEAGRRAAAAAASRALHGREPGEGESMP